MATLTTEEVTEIYPTTATCNGTITEIGSPNPTQHGFCWSISENPTIEDAFSQKGAVSEAGTFTSEITNLTSGEIYYVKAYATNSEGTAYGEQVSFTTLDPMILEYDTRLGEGSNIAIPLYGVVNVTIDWGDGNSDNFTYGGDHDHNYTSEGIYTVSISGILTHFGPSKYNSTPEKLTKVIRFGSTGLTSLCEAFFNAINLIEVPASIPATVTNLSWTFFGATIFNHDISGWDTGLVTDMSFMFYKATPFNQNIGNWNTSNVLDMSYMFEEGTDF